MKQRETRETRETLLWHRGMLRTGLPDPAFFAMITPFSEALNAVQDTWN